MRGGRIWAIGGFVAGAVLILFGVAALYLGVTSYALVRDELSQENIVGGQDMSPEAISEGIEEAGLEDVEAPDCDVVDEEIDTGEEARCFGEYMRIHALEATGGLTYAEMGRFQSADDPADPAGTNDEAEAAQDEEGRVNLILFQTMDGYDASRVLLPTLHDRLREYLGSPFAAGIPNRDILLCFRNDDETVARLRDADQRLRESDERTKRALGHLRAVPDEPESPGGAASPSSTELQALNGAIVSP